MAIRFSAWQGVDWDAVKLLLTEFTAMVNCGDILPGKRAYPVTRGAKRKGRWGTPARGRGSAQRAERAANAPRLVAVDMDVVCVDPYSWRCSGHPQLSDGGPELPFGGASTDCSQPLTAAIATGES
jgi:hypothetical protein